MGYVPLYLRAKKLAEKGYFEILPPAYTMSLAMKAKFRKQRAEKAKKLIDFLNSRDGVAPVAELKHIVPSGLHRILIEHSETFQIIKLAFGRPGGRILSANRFIKAVFVGKKFLGLRNNRTGMVRFFMKVIKLKEEGGKDYNRYEISSITHWLKGCGLSSAERVAIITRLGYKYSTHSTPYLGHMKINGYLDRKPRKVSQKPKRPQGLFLSPFNLDPHTNFAREFIHGTQWPNRPVPTTKWWGTILFVLSVPRRFNLL